MILVECFLKFLIIHATVLFLEMATFPTPSFPQLPTFMITVEAWQVFLHHFGMFIVVILVQLKSEQSC